MTKSFVLSSFILLAPLVANAGNMFGPAPFRDGSPLVTGVDGTYQATARAENLTGIFRFAYSGGSQTANARQNDWIFFVEGEVQRGSVAAAIDGGSISGIFDAAASINFSTNTNGSLTFPIFLSSQSFASGGSFIGKINLKNPSGSFNGNGMLNPAPSQVTTYQIINSNGFVNRVSITNNSDGRNYTNFFKFRGVRTSTSATAVPSTLQNPTSN